MSVSMSRRDALKGISAAAGVSLFADHWSAATLEAAEVAWLKEVQTPRKTTPAEHDSRGYFEPLLKKDGKVISTWEQWKPRRAEIRQRWMDFLGPMPERPKSTEYKVLKEDRPKGCIREYIRYESEPGLFVEGYLLRPDEETPGLRAGLVGLHQTSNDNVHEIAGVKSDPRQHLGLKMCREGFVVFCPRCYLWQDTTSIQKATDDFLKRRPKTLGMHKMLYDAMRAVDLLAALPEVDKTRIGTFGHSLGSKEAFYLLAFDERVKAAVASEGGIGFKQTNWHSPWYLGPKINAPGFKLNHHQLVALCAPRALLVLAGEKGPGAADGDRTWPYLEAALPVYNLTGKPARLGLHNHGQGHSIPPKAGARMVEWLKTYTAGENT